MPHPRVHHTHTLSYSDSQQHSPPCHPSQCVSWIALSSSTLPIGTGKRRRNVLALSTLAIGRTSSTVFLLRIDGVGIGKSPNAHWSPWRCSRGKNYCTLETIRHSSLWQGLTVSLLTVFLQNLVQCLMATHLLTSLGWLLSFSISPGGREMFSQRIALDLF